MKVLVASQGDTIGDYLTSVGYQVKSLYANDLAVKTAQKYNCEVVIYFSNLQAVVPHEEVLKAIHEAKIRVILIVEQNNPLMNYAAALGISDILLFPINPENLLYRIRHPATSVEAAELIRGNSAKVEVVKNKLNDEASDSESNLNIFRKLTGMVLDLKQNKKEKHSNIEIIPKVPVIAFLSDCSEEICKYIISKTKNNLVIFDCSSTRNKVLLELLGINEDYLWKNNWCLGLSAEPHVCKRREIRYYCIDQENPEIVDRDLRALGDLLQVLEHKGQVIFNSAPRSVIEKSKEFFEIMLI